MGGTTFSAIATGKTVAEAFSDAQASARHQYGHGGYTGTIAEKDGWVVISSAPQSLDDAMALENKLMDEDDMRISDKWGPAGAIALEGGQWLFFGWASS